MTRKTQFVSLVLLICIFLFAGCGVFRLGKKADEIEQTPAEREKAGLLKQVERKFENPKAHFQLGQLYQADGLWVKAEYEYNVTLSFAPVHVGAQAALVRVFHDSGNTAKAKLSSDIYINQVCTSAERSLRLGLAFQKQQLDDYALTCYRQALHLSPNSAKVNRQIGYYYLSKNDIAQAKGYLVRSFQLNPGQPEVAGELGRMGVAVSVPRKTEKAVKKLDKIVEQSDKEITQ